ncbi:DUF4625 domain-containing protein [Sinomicrobium soli]|uniref:DUF4625 domain-containing protein n=1 Tax=Sinomicrobium sp. N-1-3-6 TaxID=2219864 RepID=UPI000DCBE325|nr:DUF4625 domain-containing protein [Sinomicrobium sp. N-1-3-6]RAV28216.1 protein containing PKD domain-containing protein [Sinomicrobium sp. N-1-3-6]
MKSNLKFLAIVVFAGLFSVSCSNDDDGPSGGAAPEISGFEYGEGSSHSADRVAYKGSDVHLEAEISAAVPVASIDIDIHGHDVEVGEGEEEWHFHQSYTDEKYLVLNPVLHEHIDVPATAPSGEYHITLTVTDEAGNSTETEGHLQVLAPVTLSDFHIDEEVARGSDFHAEFSIVAVHGIHEITVDIHGHGIEIGEGEAEWHFDEAFSEGYHGETEAEFHEHIDVPATAPAGEYHMLFSVEDEEGNVTSYEAHLHVTAS